MNPLRSFLLLIVHVLRHVLRLLCMISPCPQIGNRWLPYKTPLSDGEGDEDYPLEDSMNQYCSSDEERQEVAWLARKIKTSYSGILDVELAFSYGNMRKEKSMRSMAPRLSSVTTGEAPQVEVQGKPEDLGGRASNGSSLLGCSLLVLRDSPGECSFHVLDL
ncbi:hypothetical protein NE237_026672 [Protea cynaroides]|uniref:Uncharacterized protein n=1 Tax=Protea cynaroides TaxID=273540 RepID=A0A9Q0H6K8_9MAGN|nr:hypothetical protein NE237_026672 [Protea cynaroides]